VRVVLVVAVVVLAALAAEARPAGAVVRCGTILVPQVYRVSIGNGARNVPDRAARAEDLSDEGRLSKGWVCTRGHASQNQAWAAACGSRAGAIVRAYGPVRAT
jgi:hypothetical protein